MKAKIYLVYNRMNTGIGFFTNRKEAYRGVLRYIDKQKEFSHLTGPPWEYKESYRKFCLRCEEAEAVHATSFSKLKVKQFKIGQIRRDLPAHQDDVWKNTPFAANGKKFFIKHFTIEILDPDDKNKLFE